MLVLTVLIGVHIIASCSAVKIVLILIVTKVVLCWWLMRCSAIDGGSVLGMVGAAGGHVNIVGPTVNSRLEG